MAANVGIASFTLIDEYEPSPPIDPFEGLVENYQSADNPQAKNAFKVKLLNFSNLNLQDSSNRYEKLISVLGHSDKDLLTSFFEHFTKMHFQLKDFTLTSSLANAILSALIFKDGDQLMLEFITLMNKNQLECNDYNIRHLLSWFHIAVSNDRKEEIQAYLELFKLNHMDDKPQPNLFHFLSDNALDIDENNGFISDLLAAATVLQNKTLLNHVAASLFQEKKTDENFPVDKWNIIKKRQTKCNTYTWYVSIIVNTLPIKIGEPQHTTVFKANLLMLVAYQFTDFVHLISCCIPEDQTRSDRLYDLIVLSLQYGDIHTINTSLQLVGLFVGSEKESKCREIYRSILNLENSRFKLNVDEVEKSFEKNYVWNSSSRSLEDLALRLIEAVIEPDRLFKMFDNALKRSWNRVIKVCLAQIDLLKINCLMPSTIDCSYLMNPDSAMEGEEWTDKIFRARAPGLVANNDPFGKKETPLQVNPKHLITLMKFINNPKSKIEISLNTQFVNLFKVALDIRAVHFVKAATEIILDRLYTYDQMGLLLEFYKVTQGSLRKKIRDKLIAASFRLHYNNELINLWNFDNSAFDHIDVKSIYKCIYTYDKTTKINLELIRFIKSEFHNVTKTLSFKGCTLEEGVLKECHGFLKLEGLELDARTSPPGTGLELSTFKISQLSLRHGELKNLPKMTSGQPLTSFQLKGTLGNPTSSDKDKKEFFGQLTRFGFVDEGVKIPCEVLESYIPYMEKVEELDITGFDLRDTSLQLLRKRAPHLTCFSAVFHGDFYTTQVKVGVAVGINAFLNECKSLKELTLDLTQVAFSKQDTIKVPSNLRSLNIKCNRKEIITQAIQDCKATIRCLNIDCSPFIESIVNDLPTQLTELRLAGKTFTPSEILGLIEKLPNLTYLAVKVDPSHQETVENMLLMRGIEPTLFKR